MKLKPNLKVFFATFLLLLVSIPMMAQIKQVKGTVLEAGAQTPLTGATVLQKGTTVATTTDAKGEYSIKVSGENPILIVQFMGFIKQEVPVKNQSVINVVLQEDDVQLEGVVVTALGISRAEKSLGYSVGKVDNETITKSVAGNWLSNLSGKVAGLTFDQASSGPTGSKRYQHPGDRGTDHRSLYLHYHPYGRQFGL